MVEEKRRCRPEVEVISLVGEVSGSSMEEVVMEMEEVEICSSMVVGESGLVGGEICSSMGEEEMVMGEEGSGSGR